MDELPDVTSPRVLNALFQQYGLQPRRFLGQNFLIDANIVRKIVSAAEIKNNDRVIEVGPGAGALTASMARAGASLKVLELDRGLARLLKDLFETWPQVLVMEQDALKVSWKGQVENCEAKMGPVKLISNLPYNISGPFMYNLFRDRFPFSLAVLMFQKEVARKLVAGPGEDDYGALSVLSRYYCHGELLFEVSKNVFWPRPKVGSAVLKLTPRQAGLFEKEEALLWDLVQGLFQQRRKTILNNMSRMFDLPREDLVELLEAVPVSTTARPEELGMEQFAMLSRITYNYLGKSN